jgi:TonB family protein
MDSFSESNHRYSAIVASAGFHSILFLLFLWTVFEAPGNQEQQAVHEELPEIFFMNPSPSANEAPRDQAVSPAAKAEKIPVQSSEPAIVVKTAEDHSEISAALLKLKIFKNDVAPVPSVSSTSTGNNSVESLTGPDHGPVELTGRTLLQRPERLTDSEEEGIVVVSIIVDEKGNVTEAVPGQRGSSTQNAALYKKAKDAAFHAKFTPSPEGLKEQKGTYTFVFTLE